MNKIGIVYGTTTGTTAKVAGSILAALGEERADLINVSSLAISDLEKYRNLILGVSTWGAGEMQDDWEGKLHLLKGADLKGKTVALFGLGDQNSYSDTFLDAMGTLYDALADAGVEPVGAWPTDGYDFEKSTAVRNGMFVGLAIDEDNQSKETRARIEAWLGQLEGEWR